MKFFLFIASFYLFITGGFCQVSISGQIKNAPDSSEITITYYNNSFEVEKILLGSIKPDKEGKFAMTFNFKRAGEAKFTIAEQYTDLYLVPGDSLYMTIDYNRFDSSIRYTGKGAADNNYMAADLLANFNWNAQLHRPFDDANKFAAFEDSLERENQMFLKAHDSPEFTPQFRNYIIATTKYRFIYPRCMYMVEFDEATNSIINKTVPDNYLDFLRSMDPNDQQAADNSRYQSALGNNYLYVVYDSKIAKEIPSALPESEKEKMRITREYELRKSLFRDKILDYQLTYFMNHNIARASEDTKFAEALMNDYRKACKNTEFIEIIEKIYAQANKLAKGNPAPDFTLVDMEGKQVSLSSLKGKVVYIDFWATWCAPCIAEMPKSHKLAEKFKTNKDIVFLYVNVRDDMESWKKYVAKEKMKGVNLFANAEQTEEIQKAYNFNGIPHYILVDKNGNLINANAERPGSIEKDILDALK